MRQKEIVSKPVSAVEYHPIPGGDSLAYHHTGGTVPGVLFCAGFHSTMEGTKAIFLKSVCQQRAWQYTRFDYRGHGDSSGEFSLCDIGQWREDALAILDHVCVGPQIIVGSSMGGWMATLLALARPEKVAGLVTIAAAPDFTEELIWQLLEVDVQNRLLNGGFWQMPSHYDNGQPYEIRMALIESGREHLVLDKPALINCPVRLLHGTGDTDVPCELSSRLLDTLSSSDARLILVKDADHRFSEPEQLALLATTLVELNGLVSKKIVQTES